MKLYKDGIFRNTVSPTLIAELKRAGYVEVKEPVEMPDQDENDADDTVSINDIYAMCDEAGVNPEDLKINGKNPTLAQVKAAIKKAKKAGK